MTESMDIQLMKRYRECLQAHPDTYLTPIASGGCSIIEAIEGRAFHVMFQCGGVLIVQWLPMNPTIQYLFDAYGT